MIQADEFLSRDYWQSLAPALHIADERLLKDTAPIQFETVQITEFAQLLRREGYFQASNIDWAIDPKPMAEAVRALSAAELSPVFAYLYDEFWVPFCRLHGLYESLLGNYAMLPDFWVWNVDPQRGDSGWKPHRDKGREALFPDGSPKSLTTWIPLSTATPLNGCIYIVPADRDPTYGTAEESRWRFEHGSIRALPAVPGDFFIWNQAVVHWGGRSSTRGAESRVSMAFEFQRLDVPPFNQPLIRPRPTFTFDIRLKLIAKQILQYRHMYKVHPVVEQLAARLMGQTA